MGFSRINICVYVHDLFLVSLYEGIVLRPCITCVFSKQETDRETVRDNRGYYRGSVVGFGQSGQVSLHRSPPGLHYNEVFLASYRLHYMQYHGPKQCMHKTMCPKALLFTLVNIDSTPSHVYPTIPPLNLTWGLLNKSSQTC